VEEVLPAAVLVTVGRLDLDGGDFRRTTVAVAGMLGRMGAFLGEGELLLLLDSLADIMAAWNSSSVLLGLGNSLRKEN
jgi:hypothetical protein